MTRPEKNVEQEKSQSGVPAWIVSFSDMVTLLLAFFVLLQSFAKEAQTGLYYTVQHAFKRNVASMGLPTLLLGEKFKLRRDYSLNKYEAEPDKNPLSRNKIIDADGEKIREIFENLKKNSDSQTSDVNEELISAVAIPAGFKSGSNTLNASARRHLDEIVVELRQNLAGQSVVINIIGLSVDEKSNAEKLMVSARRAGAVEKYLRKKFSDELANLNWRISSLGAGSSDEWTASYGHHPKDASIIIAVMGAKEANGRQR